MERRGPLGSGYLAEEPVACFRDAAGACGVFAPES